MTALELAALLDGREYGEEITPEEVRAAKEAGLVVVFGVSDDLCEFLGAIRDETDCYGGDEIHFNRHEIINPPEHTCEDCKYYIAEVKRVKTLKIIWRDEGNPCWTYETDIPHETFRIMEDGEVYCVGIVFSVEDLK